MKRESIRPTTFRSGFLRSGSMFCTAILFLFGTALAGKRPVDLYKINIDSLIKAAPSISEYASQTCVTLLSKDDIEIHEDFTFAESYHYVQLITSAEGTRELGQLDIAYRKGKDTVVVHRARVISPDGKRRELPQDHLVSDLHIKEELENDMQTDNRFDRLIFPGLQVGSIIEVNYTIYTNKIELAGHSSAWSFTGLKEALLCVSSMEFPRSRPMLTELHLFDGEVITDSLSDRIRRTWIMKHVPPLVMEAGSPPPETHSSWIKRTSFPDWKSLGYAMYDAVWRRQLLEQMSVSEYRYLEQLQLDTSNHFEAAKKLFYSVQSDIRYVGIESGINSIRPHASRVTCEKRFGDCKDMTLLLIRLLQHIGIPAYPALVGTNDVNPRPDTSFADLWAFNHVVAYVPDLDGNSYWLDATAQFSPMGWVPVHIAGNIALVLDDEASRPVEVPVSGFYRNEVRMQRTVHIDTTGAATGTVKIEYLGTPSVAFFKPLFKYASESDAKQFVHQYMSEGAPSLSVKSYSVQGLGSNDSGVTISVTFSDTAYAQPAGNLLIMHGGNMSEHFDPSGLMSERSTDVYMINDVTETWGTDLEFPPGYLLEYRPADKAIENEFYAYSFQGALRDSSNWHSTGTLSVKVRNVPLAEYPNYKSALEALNAHSRESFILKRGTD